MNRKLKPIVEFKVLAEEPDKVGHQKCHTEGWINTGLEEHLKTCGECRTMIASDLRDFAAQIEALMSHTSRCDGGGKMTIPGTASNG